MRKQLIMLFVSFLMMTTLFMSNNIKGATGDVTLTDWDDVASGLDDGTSGYFDFANTGLANYFETSTNYDVSAPNSFYFLAGANSGAINLGHGYWNLTDDYSYISSINYSFVPVKSGSTGTLTGRVVFRLNGSDQILIILNFNTNSISIWDNSISNYRSIYTSLVSTSRYYLLIEHNLTNNFHITLMNSTFGVLNVTDSAGSSTDVWTTFDQVYLYGLGVPSNPSSGIIYFDDIIINTETEGVTGGGDDEFPNLLLETPSCTPVGSMPMMRYFEWFGKVADTHLLYPYSWPWPSQPCKYIEMQQDKVVNTTIYWVDLYVDTEQYLSISSSLSDYSCRVNNNPFVFSGWTQKSIGATNGYFMRFGGSAVIENEKPLICFSSSEYYNSGVAYGSPIYWYPMIMNDECNWDSRKHNITADYTDNQLDGVKFNNEKYGESYYYFGLPGHVSPYVQYWYSGGETEYEGTEGLPTTPEMNNYTTKYGNSFIEFYENDINCRYGIGCPPKIIYHLNNTQCNLYNKYRWEIIDTTTEDIIMTGFISFTANDNEKFVIYTHWDTFKYIGQFYISLWNLTTNMQNDEIVKTSQNSIIVCSDSGCQDEGLVIDDSGIPSIDEMVASIPIFFKVILALFVIIIITICPYFFAVLIGRGTNNHIEIPALVYIAFFFVGLVISVALGFLEAWVFFVIFFGLILTFVILWIQGKSGGGEGE